MMPLAVATEWVIAAMTIMVAVGLLLTWFRTGRKPLLWGAAGALTLGFTIVAVEALVVTDEERIETAVLDAAYDVSRNDIAGALEHLHPDADDIRRRAKEVMEDYEFSAVAINKLRIAINENETPRTATVDFIAIPSGLHRASRNPLPRNAIVGVELTLVEVDGRWLIRGYERKSPQNSFRKRS